MEQSRSIIKRVMSMKTHVCNTCGAKLIVGVNTLKTLLDRYEYDCQICRHIKYMAHRSQEQIQHSIWYRSHRPEVLAQQKIRYRLEVLDTVRGRLVGKKRPYPIHNQCELNSSHVSESLQYHHWDDTDLMKGMWVCSKCHHLVEGFERAQKAISVIQDYTKLKNQINQDALENKAGRSLRE